MHLHRSTYDILDNAIYYKNRLIKFNSCFIKVIFTS